MVSTGIVLLWVAQATADGRVRRNQLVGIRLASTMASDEAWLAAHRTAKRPTQAAGWCSILCVLPALLPTPMVFVVGAVLAGGVVIFSLVLYGAVVGRRAARSLAKNET